MNHAAAIDATETHPTGQRIRLIRKSRDKSLQVIAGLAGIGTSTLHRIECGKRDVTLSEIVALANALEITCSTRDGDGRHVYLDRLCGEGPAPILDVIDSASVAGTDPVAVALRAAGPVARLRNPDLWDAIATSIIRQVIRAGQARKLYRAFCHGHGGTVETSIGTVALFPSPDTVLALPDAEFARLGLAFKCRPLRSAAQAYLEFGAKWLELEPERLLAEIQSVPHIGPWTAGATVADTTNDYALYPFADLAVRIWAKHLASGRSWPNTEPEFARAWQRLAKGQLSERTLLTLAWGVRHAHSTGTVAL